MDHPKTGFDFERIKLLNERIKANERKARLRRMKQDGQFIC